MAKLVHTCTGCVPIDAAILKVYAAMVGAISESHGMVIDDALSGVSRNPVENRVITNALTSKYTKPANGIPASDLASGVIPDVSGLYTKPADGIPAEDIASGVIPDVSGFVTKSVSDLLNYYLKSETYTKSEVQAMIGAIQGFSYEVVASLPTASASTKGKIYLVPSSDPQAQNVKDEFITIDNGASANPRYTWEQIGSTSVNLSGYVTTTQLNTALADYTTTANLTSLLAAKQDVIQDLSTIRSGASAGATAYQKPASGIPASDIASGVIPSVPTISTDVSADAASDIKTSSPKSVKTYVDSGIAAVESDLSDLEDVVGAIDIGAYVIAWDGNSTPVVANIPAGVTVTYNTTTYTGELAASASTIQKIYLVATGTTDNYDRYITVGDSTYSWVNLGTTEITLADYATKTEISQLEHEVGGLATPVTITEYIAGKYITDAGTVANLAAKSISQPIDVVEGDVLVGKITDVQAFITALAYYSGSDNRNFTPIYGGGQTASGFVYTVTKTGQIVACYDNSHLPTITHLKSTNIRSLRGNVESNKDVLDALCKILGYGKTVTEPEDDETGKYVSSEGVISTYSLYNITKGVAVKKGDYVILNRVNAASVAAAAAIYADGTYYPQVLGNGSNAIGKYEFIADRDGDVVVSYTTPYSSDYFGSPITVTVYSATIVESTPSPSPSPTPSVDGFDALSVVNLFDKTTVTKGKYIGTDGTLTDNSRYSVSDFIPVEVGKKYTYPAYRTVYGGNLTLLNCYNENKERIGYVNGVADENDVITTEITLSGTAFVRVTVMDTTVTTAKNLFNHIGVFMFVNSESLPDKYIPYGETAKVSSDITVNDSDGLEFNPLRGKSVVFLGDSICNAGTGGDTKDGWAGRIGTKNRMMYANKGVGGATLTKNTGWGTTCISEMDLLGGADYIIFEGGTNDADRIGSILNGNTPALLGTFDDHTYNATFDNTTFCGAVEYLIKRILDTYPGSKVGYIVAPKMGATNNGYAKDKNNRRAYFDLVMQICDKWGIPYLNLWDENPMNPSLASFYTSGSDASFYSDGQHLTSKGYDRISDQIEDWMKTL